MPAQDSTSLLEQLARFDRPVPRYTSYPTAVEFHEGVGADDYVEAPGRADAGRAGAPSSFYADLPFCEQRCLFCGCHVVITPHMPVAGGSTCCPPVRRPTSPTSQSGTCSLRATTRLEDAFQGCREILNPVAPFTRRGLGGTP